MLATVEERYVCKRSKTFENEKEKLNSEFLLLVRLNDEVLIGVTSYAREMGREIGQPQVFSNVFNSYGWISNVTSMKLPECESISSKLWNVKLK